MSIRVITAELYEYVLHDSSPQGIQLSEIAKNRIQCSIINMRFDIILVKADTFEDCELIRSHIGNIPFPLSNTGFTWFGDDALTIATYWAEHVW